MTPDATSEARQTQFLLDVTVLTDTSQAEKGRLGP